MTRRTGDRRVGRWILLAAAAAAPVLGAAGGGDLALFDAPRGAWLASVRSSGDLVVLEEREGWRRVRLEGWMPAPAGEGAGERPTPGTAPPAVAPPMAQGTVVSPGSAPAGAPAEGMIEGILFPLAGMQPATPGADLVVRLVGDLEHLDADHKTLGDECRGEIARDDARVADLESAARHALNSSENFHEAAARSDRAKADLARTRAERDETMEGCRRRADALFDRYAVVRTLSDASGRFAFHKVVPGRYRILAVLHGSGASRSWCLPADIEAGQDLVLDPRTLAPGPDPYWGLR
jgi:hypothetical protein